MSKGTKKAAGKTVGDPVLKELSRIRNLLVLDLLSRGLPSDLVGMAVQLEGSNIRHMFPVRKIRAAMQATLERH